MSIWVLNTERGKKHKLTSQLLEEEFGKSGCDDDSRSEYDEDNWFEEWDWRTHQEDNPEIVPRIQPGETTIDVGTDGLPMPSILHKLAAETGPSGESGASWKIRLCICRSCGGKYEYSGLYESMCDPCGNLEDRRYGSDWKASMLQARKNYQNAMEKQYEIDDLLKEIQDLEKRHGIDVLRKRLDKKKSELADISHFECKDCKVPIPPLVCRCQECDIRDNFIDWVV